MVFCAICKLESGTLNDVSFHKLPKDEKMRDKWIEIIGSNKINKYTSVCCQHFEEKDFVYKVHGGTIRRFIHPLSVPSPTIVNNKRYEIEACSCSSGNSLLKKFRKKLVKTEYGVQIVFEEGENSENEQFEPCENSNDENIFENFEEYIPEEIPDQVNSDTNVNDSDDSEFESVEVKTDDTTFDNQYTINEIIELENTNKTSRKRKNDEKENTKKKRRRAPRFVGELTRPDFTSDVAWNLVRNFVEDSKKQEKFLTDTIKKLGDKVKSLEAILAEVKKRQKAKCQS